MELFTEKHAIKKGLASQDVSGGAESDRISLKECLKLTALVRLETGIATDCQVTLRQHDAAAGGNSKDLLSTIPHVYRVDGSDHVKVEADSVAAKDVAALDTAAGYIALQVDPSDLDVNADFNHISVSISDPGAARIASVTYLCETKCEPGHDVN